MVIHQFNSNFQNLILNFDGVLADTNSKKLENIKLAVEKVIGKASIEFLNFFKDNSGISREKKIHQFYDSELSIKIIKAYEEINQQTLLKTPLVSGAKEFLEYAQNKFECIFILSGGKKSEIIKILEFNSSIKYFKNILDQEKTKSEHIFNYNFNKFNSLFIGDSRYDYEVANKAQIPFIFMPKYSDFKDWELFCSNKKINICFNFKEVERIIK